MIALTQEKREELIADCEFNIKRLKILVEDFPEEKSLEKVLLREKIALASLTTSAVGSFHIYEQKVDATTDYVRDGEWPIDEGELLVYAAPPVPDIKFPDAMPDMSESNAGFLLGFHAGADWYENEIKRLNGLGE